MAEQHYWGGNTDRGSSSAAIVSRQSVSSGIDLGDFTSFEYLAIELKAESSELIVTLHRPFASSLHFEFNITEL